MRALFVGLQDYVHGSFKAMCLSFVYELHVNIYSTVQVCTYFLWVYVCTLYIYICIYTHTLYLHSMYMYYVTANVCTLPGNRNRAPVDLVIPHLVDIWECRVEKSWSLLYNWWNLASCGTSATMQNQSLVHECVCDHLIVTDLLSEFYPWMSEKS